MTFELSACELVRHRLDGLTALVVDDNFSARMTLASMLRAFGMQVTEPRCAARRASGGEHRLHPGLGLRPPQHAPDGVLQKPITPSTLLDALYALLSKRDALAADGQLAVPPATAEVRRLQADRSVAAGGLPAAVAAEGRVRLNGMTAPAERAPR